MFGEKIGAELALVSSSQGSLSVEDDCLQWDFEGLNLAGHLEISFWSLVDKIAYLHVMHP